MSVSGPSQRRSLRLFGALALAVSCVGTFALAVPSSASAPKYVTRWVAAADCSVPKAGHLGCFALRLKAIRVKSGSSVGRARAAVSPAALPLGPSGGYTPADLATAYGVNSDSAVGSTQTVGIVDAYSNPNVTSELNVFNAKYGLPAESATSFRVVNQTGAASPLPVADAGWAGEIALDVQTVRGLCHTCKIVLVEANSNSWADLGTAENQGNALGATVLSNSFGGPEGGSPPPPSFISAFNHPGKVITVSTGDDGWWGWDFFNTHQSPQAAAQQPSTFNTVVAVGGTSLYLNDNGTRADEVVWNNNGPKDYYGYSLGTRGATGGGCSTQATAQPWQNAVAAYASLGCASGKRSAGDVAAIADPFTGYDIYRSYGVTAKWYTYGGTSLAAPAVAAMWALAGGSGGVSYPALSLYGHFKTFPSTLYDVTTGGNGACDTASTTSCSKFFGGNPNVVVGAPVDCAFASTGSTLVANKYQCYAQPGYDGPSGTGTPKGITPFLALSPTAAITVPATVKHGLSATFKGNLSTDPFPGGVITQYLWTWGDGSTTSTASSSITHTYAAAGTRTVTLRVTDNYGRPSLVKSVSVVVH